MVCMERSAVDTSVDPAAAGGVPADGATVAAVLAVKSLRQAKSRLAATLWDSRATDRPGVRGSLVLAMFLDTVEALRGAGVTRIVVVSPDAEVLAAARRSGTRGLPESASPRAGSESGLNTAFGHGARWVRRTWPDSGRLLFVQADLPAATSTSFREVLAETPSDAPSFVTDRDGTGTVLLHGAVAPGDPVEAAPRFGPGSASAHREVGAVELDPAHRRWLDLRTDVDTATDLATARQLGLGPHTTRALRDI
ncbi:2-phospho-L-lactate guanylyltransferase [Gordonia paraffinivorans]|uniref:Phosphoenolpyruvate guanylyltransferase n=2 Tax=Gordonia paraffinivorans TaxID=175628 RepID=A0ABD7UXT3_9ACTN|nr:2-phospho-L-lactate guanylyltransferase [Gordonia paraffinivorans]